jgi:PAS domain S-box-containing protein
LIRQVLQRELADLQVEEITSAPELDRRLRRANRFKKLKTATALFDSVPVGLYRATPDGHLTDANLTLARMAGYPDRESLLASNALEMSIAPQDRRRMQALLKRRGIVHDFETRVQRPDGTVVWLEHNAQTIRDANRQVLYYEGSLRDITERKQAEEILQRRNRELALFNQVGQTLTATLDLRQILEQVLRTVTQTIGAEGSSIWLRDEQGEGGLVCRAASHPGPNNALINLRLRPGQGIAGWVAQTGQSACVACAPNDSRFANTMDAQTGFHTLSSLAAPLRVRETIIGVLEVVNKLNGEFDAGDVALVETLATWAAIAIDNAQLVEALSQRTVELQARNKELDAFAHRGARPQESLEPHARLFELLEHDFATL